MFCFFPSNCKHCCCNCLTLSSSCCWTFHQWSFCRLPRSAPLPFMVMQLWHVDGEWQHQQQRKGHSLPSVNRELTQLHRAGVHDWVQATQWEAYPHDYLTYLPRELCHMHNPGKICKVTLIFLFNTYSLKWTHFTQASSSIGVALYKSQSKMTRIL